MGKKRNRLQKCSLSIDADTAGEPSHKAKRDSGDLEIVNLKKQKKPIEGDENAVMKKETEQMRISFQEMVEATKKLVDLMPTKADLQNTTLLKKSDEDGKTTLKKGSDEDENIALKKEIEEMTNSFKEMSEFVKKQQEKILTKADLLKYSFKEKVEEIYECNFETKDSMANGFRTIFVQGFKCSRTREDAKSLLRKHFSSCGAVGRVYVPIECKTGSLLGFAFIDMLKDEEKALTLLNGSYLEGMMLVVVMARDREESIGFKNFKGCQSCYRNLLKRRRNSIYDSPYGSHIQRSLKLQKFLDKSKKNAW
ncbi:Nucleolin 2 [Cardamine amara subsp. amara]|uniref:Nucleolin 2 n=1 Tax=Cardamine amara subsp. amara TaxID=228776 RepID=A0ABD1BKM0_CARAN